ncbi:hypothetical protein Gorai_007590, partial [Gossypium raimondii]|nr:hypothetical protein [Gossypium raimondii]
VFEKLGPSLFDFLKRNKYSPFPVDLVREFVHQLLESVAYMHDLLLINTDLKPENILLVSSEYVKLPGWKVVWVFIINNLCLFRFGVGVILLIFGVGCILIELCTVSLAFLQMNLALFRCGTWDLTLPRFRKIFRSGSRLNWPEGAVSRESIRAVKKLDRLKNMVSQHVESSRYFLADLLEGLLKYDPSERLTARQALNHPFFSESK